MPQHSNTLESRLLSLHLSQASTPQPHKETTNHDGRLYHLLHLLHQIWTRESLLHRTSSYLQLLLLNLIPKITQISLEQSTNPHLIPQDRNLQAGDPTSYRSLSIFVIGESPLLRSPALAPASHTTGSIITVATTPFGHSKAN